MSREELNAYADPHVGISQFRNPNGVVLGGCLGLLLLFKPKPPPHTRPAGYWVTTACTTGGRKEVMEDSVEPVDFGKDRRAASHFIHLRAVRPHPVLGILLADQHVGCLLEVNLPSS